MPLAFILCSIILGFVILVMTLIPCEKKAPPFDMPFPVYIILKIGLLLLFIFLHFYRVDEVPIPYHSDEAGAVYDGYCLANYHCDRFGVRFPVYFMNFGTHGSSALYGYSAALMFTLFGYSILSARLPAILLAVLSVIAISAAVRRDKGKTESILILMFFCILPFLIMHSRWGLDAYLLFPMITISCSLFYFAVLSEKTICYIISGLVFGLTLYSYSVSYVIIPVFIGVNLIFLLIINKTKWRQIFALSIPLFILALPLILMIAVNNDYFPEIRTRFFSVPKLESYSASVINLHNIVDNLRINSTNIFYRMFVDDFLIYNVIPKFGTMYYISIPLILYGFFLSVKKLIHSVSEKQYGLDFMMTALFIVVFFINLIVEDTNINRLCALYLPMTYYLVIASYEIMCKKKILAVITLGAFLILFVFFIGYYFEDFNKKLDTSPLIGSITELGEAVNYADSVNKNDELIYILDPLQTYVYTMLIKGIDPYTFNEQKILSYDDYVKVVGHYRFRLDAVMPECIYIFRDRTKMPENLDEFGFAVKKFGSFWVYYPEF